MKPDWNKAPDWADYLAQDGDGSWNWFRFKPECDHEIASWECELDDYQEARIGRPNACWYLTLETRPL